MPTGYTADLYEGKDVSFEDFTWDCARAFGALVTLRDEPEAAIPEVFEADTAYSDERIADAEQTLRRLETMTVDQADAAAHREWLNEKCRHEGILAKRKAITERYDAMLAQVYAWDPPTADHLELKTFMTDQLKRSIEFDTGTDYLTEPQRLTAEEWVAKERESAERQLARSTEERAKTIERAAQRTAWVKALRESLGGVPA